MAKTLAAISPCTSQSNAAAATFRSSAIDVSGVDGGEITMKITNGASAPTMQCLGKILLCHKQGSMPAAAAEGTDWKVVAQFGGGVVASDIQRFSYKFGPEKAYLHVEFSGNTGQAVTVEALGTTFVY